MPVEQELFSALAPTGGGGPAFYKPSAEASDDLEQGDIIPRSAPVIDHVLRQYHPYHVEKPANEMFAVLTQSCDLARHEGKPKTRYIALAPIRPLRLILRREFGEFLIKTPGDLYVLGSVETQGRYDDFLTKLVNNNDSRYFFLPQRVDLQIAEDMCVMLPLSMSIRAEHYEACLAGRVAQVSDLFQAKLGWLLGQQFSRVGTPDWTPDALAAKVQSVSEKTLSWMPDHEFIQIKAALKQYAADNPGADLDETQFAEMRGKIQSKRDVAITAVIEALVQLKILEPPPNKTVWNVRKELRRNPTFAAFFPGS